MTNRPGDYLNLATKRIVKNAPKDADVCWGIKGVAIVGTRAQVEQYAQNNKIEDPEYVKPFQNIRCLCETAIAVSKSAVRNDRAICGTSEIVTAERSKQYGIFESLSFDNIETNAEVLRVVDGDTFDILVYITLDQLARKRNDNEFSIIVPSQHKDAGFYTKLCVRLYGVDTSEKQLEAGKLAKTLMTEKLQSMENLVTVHFIDQCRDKYGRSLVIMYSRHGELLNTLFEDMPELAAAYTGGTKTLNKIE